MRSNTKLIVSLIKRVEVRLPINNAGATIEVLEQDSITQQTVAAIIELSSHKIAAVVNQLGLVLDSVSKNVQPPLQSSVDPYIPLDILQSQLFIIRLISACLQHHWTWYKKQAIRLSRETNHTEEAKAAASAIGAYADFTSSNISSTNTPTSSNLSAKLSFNDLKNTDTQIDPPSLDENLTAFILNLMTEFLTQMHIIEERNDQLSTLSSEYPNDALTSASKVDPQTMEYIREIYTTTGKILYYISASNWSIYYAKIKLAISTLSTASESLEFNPPEIRILAFASLNIPKLQAILSDLSSYFMSMKIQGKLLFAKMMRMAIWKWIEMKPTQFAEICSSTSRPLAGSEILFDMCNVAADSSRKKAVLWPLQTILLALSPDFLVQAFLDDRGLQNRRTAFPRQLKKALQSTRTQEIAAICYVDLCKAATYIAPEQDSILRHIAEDIEDILCEKVWDFTRSSAVDTLSSSLGYTISHQALVNDYFLASLRLDPAKTLNQLVPDLLEDDAPTVFKQAFINACINVILEERTSSWNPTIHTMYSSVCTPLRRIFVQTVKVELSYNSARSDTSNSPTGSRKANSGTTIANGKSLLLQQHNITSLLQSILKLFKLDPLTALLGQEHRVDEITQLMSSLVSLMRHNDRRVRKNAADVLILLNDPSNIKHWSSPSSLIQGYWKIASQTKISIARFIVDNRQQEELTKGLLELLLKLMSLRNAFLATIKDTPFENIEVHDRIQASVTLEIALLISLCSPVPDICSVAIQCLGHMCVEARLVDEESLIETTSRTSQNFVGFSHNIEIYEDLSYDEPVVQGVRKQTFVGRKAQQKRVRKYLRMITTPTTGILTAWEEVWKRWKVLTPIVSRFGMDSLRDLNTNNSSSYNEMLSTTVSSGSSVKKIGGLVRHDKLRTSSVRTAAPVPVGRIETDDEKQTEWQNFTGFLAALGGSQLPSDTNDESVISSNEHLRIASPSRLASLVERFISEMVDLLTSENVVIREGAKDTLGGDLSPALYSILFRYLEQGMAQCFSSNGEVICDSVNTLFVEQTVLVLKMILDRLTDPNDCLLSIDFSTLILRLANYINRLPHENYTTMRIMIMMCHLTEVLMLKKEQVIIRDDVKIRNQLLEIIVEWTSDFTLASQVMNRPNTIQLNTQNKEVQRDLDQVCLKAIVAILHKLPLQLTDQSREIDRGISKSRLFQKYFTFFTQLLDRCHKSEADTSYRTGSNLLMRNTRDLYNLSKSSDQYWGPLKETAVTAVSNLLSANVDAGLRHALAMGYHEDVKTRTAFMQVLSNILNQGAQFDTLAENIITDRYEKLVELLVESDIDIALTLCDVCPSSEASNVAQILLTAFESRGKVIDLLKAIIEREVHLTEQEATLFRGTNIATRILSIFARESCIDYLRITLQPAIEHINALPDEQLTWEMDPQKIGPNESVTVNKKNVCRATDVLLNAICTSASKAPRIFRKELSLIVEAVNKRFPDASKTAVGGFVFLRLFNPAILTPENSGFSKTALPRSKLVRKLLLQATRMIQNLANNMMFGAKETHLISLNDFITNNLYRVASFLREVSSIQKEGADEPYEVRGIRMDDGGYVALHRFLSDNLDKITRELSVRRARTSTDTQKLLEWKRTMDKFSNLLAQLGTPSDSAPNKDFSATRNYALVNGNNYYSEFMRRNKHRDLSYISSLQVFYHGGVSKSGRPVFYMISRKVVGENFDYELLIYYMLRVMEPHLNHPFELLFDLTRFSEEIEIPIHWMNQFFQLIFSEMNDFLVILHLYNPNFHMQRYVRKLPRIITNKLVKRARFASSISELSNYIAPSEIRLPKETCEIEKETGMTIPNAHIVSTFKVLIPVKIMIGSEHLIVTTYKEQEIFWSLNSVLTNVFGMTDISGIYLPAIPPSKKPTDGAEIHITHDKGKSTMILVVPNREEVYKYLMDRKKSFETNMTDISHGIRPSDVPGRILNIALVNIGSENYTLRSQAYNLLCSLCLSFRFGVDNKLMNAKDLSIPFNSTNFIVSISDNIAISETHLTLEFLNECILGFNRSSSEPARQLTILEYMVPWLKNLTFFTLMPHGKEPSKVKDVIRSLITMTASKKTETYEHIQEKIWKTLKDIEELHHLVIEALIQYSVENGIGSPQAEAMADTINTMNSNAIRGKIISRMRRVLLNTSQNCRPSLVKHQSWPEIGCLIRFMLMLSFYQDTNSKSYVAEVFHIISMVVAIGPTFIRSSVHELLVNSIHLLVTNKHITSENRKKLKFVLDDVCDKKYRIHFGLNKSYANAFTITEETMTDNTESMNLASLEVILRLMLDAVFIGAPSIDVANSWHARWMSLVTSMTFQFNPALQPRSFVVLGCLVQDEIDDDLLFQILVVLRNELARFDPSNPDLVISIMMCLVNIIDNLSSNSRYIKPMFWLAVGMINLNHTNVSPHAIKLLHSVLRTLDAHKCFSDGQSVERVLMDARAQFAPICKDLDASLGFSFDTQFSFAIASILMKGYKCTEARENIFACLTTFLEIETKLTMNPNLINANCLGYFCGLLLFSAKTDTLIELLSLAGISDIDMESVMNSPNIYATIWRAVDIPNNTTGIILVSFLVGLLSLAENETERLFLYSILSRAAVSTPEVFSLVYDSLIPKMNSIIVSTENSALIETVRGILITACSEPSFNSADKISNQQAILERIGFKGLAEANYGLLCRANNESARLTSELLRIICE